MEIPELNQLPYEKRKKIVKRLYEKKYMTRQEMYKTTYRGRKLKKEEAIALDQLLTEVENEVPEVIPEKVVTPERKPEPEVVKEKIVKPDVVIPKIVKPKKEKIVEEPKVVKEEKKIVEETPEEKVITKEILQEAIKNAKWNTAAYVNAIAKMDRKNPYGDPSNEDFEKKEIIEEFYNLALYPENFKKIKDLPAFKNI